MTTPGGAVGALSGARLLGRNWPLALLVALIGVLFWPTEDATADEDVVGRKPNGPDHMPSSLKH